MSQENVEIARRCCESFDRGEYEVALEALDPEIEYDMIWVAASRYEIRGNEAPADRHRLTGSR